MWAALCIIGSRRSPASQCAFGGLSMTAWDLSWGESDCSPLLGMPALPLIPRRL